MKKGKLAALLALGMLLSTGTAYGAEDAPYNPGPMLDGIQISSRTAGRGGKISVAADAWDSDGIRSIWVRFIHDESGKVLSLPLLPRRGDPCIDGYWSGELELPEDAPLGVYVLRSVVLVDQKEGRTRYLREADMNWNARDTELLEEEPFFQLVEDAEGPLFLGCAVLQNAVQAGEGEDGRAHTARITLTARDEAAGFQKATLVFQEPGGKKLFAALDRNDWAGDELYQKDLPIREHQAGGEYRLVKATLEDRVGNKTILGYGKDALPLEQGFSCGFRVLSQEEDRRLAPALQSVRVTGRKTYEDHTEYEIAVGAVPRGSEVHHITVRFKNDATGSTVSKVIRAEGQDFAHGLNVYAGWLSISQWEAEGTFILDGVVLTDEAGNAQTYCRPENVRGSQLALPCTASFQAKTGQKAEDDTPPVVLELEMEPRTSVGYNTTLRVRAADDRSGVDTIRARFENDEYGVIVFSLYPDLEREGWFTGHIPGARLTRWDQYELTRLVVADKAGNRRTYLPEAGARGEALPRQVVLTVDDNRD